MSTSNYGVNITPTGITIDDNETNYAAMIALWVAAFALQNKTINTSVYTPQGQMATSMADIVNNKNIDLLSMINNLDIDKASGLWLDMLCKLFALERKAAVPTKVTCTITGLSGTIINGKTESNPFQAADTAGNTYQPSETYTIGSGGTVSVIMENIVGGDIECLANTLTTILTTTNGIDTINNPSDGTVGSNLESDADLRTRYKNLVQQNASGTIGALQTAVLALDGVLDCAGRENQTDSAATVNGYSLAAHTFALSVLEGNSSDIAQAILAKKSIASQSGNTSITTTDTITGQTYTFTIIRPVRLNYYFHIKIANESDLPSNISDIVKEAVFNNFYAPRVKIASTTYASRFFSPINAAYNGINIAEITMASKTDSGTLSAYGTSVVCNLDQYPDLSKDNITIEYV